ncbi:hypothetical protein LTR36_004882 [Oleoguttula mirabilis]|uniref:Uncharacterized protein n=1 Tax=Oleoguttula mirabilis TaxID=1507867 RepID=A0AAV9JGA5_9PEZI|nr:hypothetical protein LTR36_004882 [Oleoguttula mirabilis]
MARHQWSSEQRTLLWLLHTRFSLSKEDIARLFNTIYATALRENGYPKGMKVEKIKEEYDHRDKAGKSKMWEEICNADDWQVLESTTINDLWLDAMLEDIWHAAEKLAIALAEAANIYDSVVGGRRIVQAERRVAQGIRVSGGYRVDPLVCNKVYVDAHPTLNFDRIRGEEPSREGVEGGAYRYVR